MSYIEDMEEDLNDIEYVWSVKGIQDYNLALLLDRLLSAVLTEEVPHAQYRALLRRAVVPPRAACVSNFLRLRDLEVDFRSTRNVIEVDAVLTPYYGNVIPALAELQALGLHAAAQEMWLDAFQQRSPVNRVATVAQMVTWAALLLLGQSQGAMGAPSRKARTEHVTRPVSVPYADSSAAVLLAPSFSLSAVPTPQLELATLFTLAAHGTLT